VFCEKPKAMKEGTGGLMEAGATSWLGKGGDQRGCKSAPNKREGVEGGREKWAYFCAWKDFPNARKSNGDGIRRGGGGKEIGEKGFAVA